jgi:hypothetical protein
MVLDKWLTGELMSVSLEMVETALNELEGEEGMIVDSGESGESKKCWNAWTRLTLYVSFLNVASQQYPSKQPAIIQRLLNWIQKIKGALDKIVKGIGGNGYSIGVSVPFGVSISISFPV